MTQTLFLTGTDTDVGKTLVATGLLQRMTQQGFSTAAFKPVSAGCEDTEDGLRNDDALQLQKVASLTLSYEQVNPIAFADPVAPHLAAAKAGVTIDESRLSDALKDLQSLQPDLLLVEGAGGWHLPLSDHYRMSQWVVQHQMSVVLVVGMKLGCLNHALLSIECIKRAGLCISGWVANQIDPHMSYFDENIASLNRQIEAPCLGVVPYLKNRAAENVAGYLDISPLQILKKPVAI